ncbi:MAG: N-acetyltransferase [Duncaniella sp.]|nr:N-acetyltransferase [Duncaniella sp.]
MKSPVTVTPVSTDKSSLRRYVKWGISLYDGNPYYVPPLVFDDVNTLDPKKNPAFEVCEAQSFMAYRDGEPVGRITAIINRVVNERSGRKEARFGFVDFIDDAEAVDALFAAAEQWARDRGMDEIVGPMGFTDLDHEGMLTAGFEETGTMATIYNYPYYPAHMERMGYKVDTSWVEFRIDIPSEIPEKMARISRIVMDKYKLRLLHFDSTSKLKKAYGKELFELINEAYDNLYGYSPLTPAQIDYYIDMYLGFIKLEYVSVVVEENGRLAGVGITMPSLSKALIKSRGRLFPTGWFHLLRALKGHNDVVDLMLIAVRKEYLNKGVNALFFYDLIPEYIRNGVKYAESNLELEENSNVQAQWQYFTHRLHRRRSAFRKHL